MDALIRQERTWASRLVRALRSITRSPVRAPQQRRRDRDAERLGAAMRRTVVRSGARHDRVPAPGAVKCCTRPRQVQPEFSWLASMSVK
jgi:hypothetical protein